MKEECVKIRNNCIVEKEKGKLRKWKQSRQINRFLYVEKEKKWYRSKRQLYDKK